MMKARVLAAAMTLFVGTSVSAQTTGGAAAFIGRWQVTGVAVSDDGVQALSDNDPSLMGKRVTVSPERLSWDGPSTTHDACVDPQFTQLGTPAPAELRAQLRKLGMPRPTAFAIRCGSGSWGPGDGAMIFRGAGGKLAMPWYDGGLLQLAMR